MYMLMQMYMYMHTAVGPGAASRRAWGSVRAAALGPGAAYRGARGARTVRATATVGPGGRRRRVGRGGDNMYHRENEHGNKPSKKEDSMGDSL